MSKPRLLCVTGRVPSPGVFGDALRSWALLRGMARQYDLTLITLDQGGSPAALAAVQEFCEDVILVPHGRLRAVRGAVTAMLRGRPAQCGYFDSPRLRAEVKSAVDSRTYAGAYVQLARLDSIVDCLGNLPLLMDFVDALSLQWERRRESTRGPGRLFHALEARRLRAVEMSLMQRASAGLVTGADDARHLESLVDVPVPVDVLPNGVDLERFTPPATEPPADRAPILLFHGNLDYRPNGDTVRWFATEVMPLVHAARPSARFVAAGKLTSRSLRKLARSHGVEFTGFVDDLNQTIGQANICVAPMVSGAGIQNKVLEAMAAARPVVATRLANAGIGAQHGREIMIAAAPQAMADAIVRLLDQPATANQLGHGGRAFVTRRFNWDAQADVASESLDCALRRPRPLPDKSARSVPAPTRPLAGLTYRVLRAALHAAIGLPLFLTLLLLALPAWITLQIRGKQPRIHSCRRIGRDRRWPGECRFSGHDRRRHDQKGQPFTALDLAVSPLSSDARRLDRLAWRSLQMLLDLPLVVTRHLNLVGPASTVEIDHATSQYGRRGVRPGLLSPERSGARDDDATLAATIYRLRRSDPRLHLASDLDALRQNVRNLTSREARS